MEMNEKKLLGIRVTVHRGPIRLVGALLCMRAEISKRENMHFSKLETYILCILAN